MKYYIIWVIAALIFITGSFFTSDSSLDIHLHDTYFVIAYQHVFWMVAFICLIFAFLYYLFKSLLFSGVLSFIHIVITLMALTVILLPTLYENTDNSPRRYADYSSWESLKQFADLNPVVSMCLLLSIPAQLLFPLHIVIGVIKKVLKK